MVWTKQNCERYDRRGQRYPSDLINEEWAVLERAPTLSSRSTGAGWHGAEALNAPANITLLVLPPYSPELNPVENVWEYLRKNKLANRLYQTYEDIVAACCTAWNELIATPTRIASIASRDWANMS